MKLSKILGLIALTSFSCTWVHAQSTSPPQGKTPNFTAQAVPQSTGQPTKQKVEFAEHRVIVKFKSQTAITPGSQANEALSASAITALGGIQGTVIKSFSNINAHLVQTPMKVGKAIEVLYRSGAVQYAEPDYKVQAIATTPNDPKFVDLWGLNNTGQNFGTPDADIDAPEAWDIRTDASNVIVGVVDTGVDYGHVDLSANMWKNPKEIPGNGIDDDGNGWVDDVYGIDTCNDDSDPMDDHFHGTHVSGTIGARGNNGVGVAGVAWKTKIMALKFLCGDGFGFTSDAIDAINYALITKLNNNYPRMVLSNSWGGGGFSQSLFDTISIAKGMGVLFIAAASNDGMNTDTAIMYPSGYNIDNIISVGASDVTDNRAWFSNYGCSSVDVFAPGDNIESTTPGNSYEFFSGTSMATPHISGMAALIWAKNPGKNWKSIKSAIMNSVDQSAAMSRISVSQGRANLYKALQADAMSEPTIWGVSPSSASPGETISINGFNFGITSGAVEFNGAALTVLSWSNTTIKARLDTKSLGTGSLKIIKADNNVSDVGGCFEVAFKPSLMGQTLIPRAWASGARAGGKYWIIGGEAPWGITGIVESVNLATYSSISDSKWMMPIPLSNTGSAAIGSKIFVVGGYDSSSFIVSSSLQIFDTVTKTWTSGAALPEPLLQTSVVSIGDKLYVFGGMNAFFSAVNTTYIYDSVGNTWTTGASKVSAAAYATATVAPGSHKITVSGGFSCSFFGCEQNAVEIYDTTTDSWTSSINLNHPRAGAAGAYFNGKDHVLFGAPLNSSGEYFTGSEWIDAISGPALYTGLGTVCSTCKAIIILTGYDLTSFFNPFSSNIWLLRE